jgi:hypothetical protein
MKFLSKARGLVLKSLMVPALLCVMPMTSFAYCVVDQIETNVVWEGDYDDETGRSCHSKYSETNATLTNAESDIVPNCDYSGYVVEFFYDSCGNGTYMNYYNY